MNIINTISELRDILNKMRLAGKKIGFVPTMGYLHEGHLSLVKSARRDNDVVVMSIFVNPTQFGEGEDLDSYPRDLKRDSSLAESAGVDIVFAPTVDEMYPKGYNTYVNIEGNITNVLCGASRDGHFKGVTTIVSKLFNIVQPSCAYFGQKDAQQVAVIKQMVKDLNMPIDIISCPIVREKDGLALSSRNTYLSDTERIDALVLSKSLNQAKEMIESGERDAKIIKDMISLNISEVKSADIDYIEVVDANTLESISRLEGEILIALAVKVGQPRLIDNMMLEVK